MPETIAPDLAGKSVLITGASTGIGAAAARAFARAGCRVAIHYNASLNRAEEVAADVRFAGAEAFLVGGDLRSSAKAREVVDAAAAHFGGLDILINNAGGLVQRVPIAEVDDAFFDAVMDLNVRSLVAACSAAVPHMRKAGRGNIVNVTSIAARHGGGAGAVMYASAKGFVSTFTHGLAKEVVKDNIRVNAVSPGVIDDAVPRALFDAGDARVVQGGDPDGPPRHGGGMRGRVPVSRLRRAVRLRHRPDPRGERRAADAVIR